DSKLHMLMRFRGALQVDRRERDQGLFQVLAGFDHVVQMPRRQPQTPWIRQRMPDLRAQREQIRVLQRDYLLLLRLTFGPQDEFNVNRVGMTNRDPGLKPPKLDLPRTPERIGSGLKSAIVVDHELSD